MLRAVSRLLPSTSMVRSVITPKDFRPRVGPFMGQGPFEGTSQSPDAALVGAVRQAPRLNSTANYFGGFSAFPVRDCFGQVGLAQVNLGKRSYSTADVVPKDVIREDLRNRIESAPVYDVATKTPLVKAEKISERLGNGVFLKREDYQPGFSFKVRGAYTKLKRMHEQEPLRRVIAASAGNHAQGVALAARELGIKADIVMPVTTPGIKVSGVRALGANVILEGQVFDDAAEFAKKRSVQDEVPFISPYDDWDIIAGQGTVGKEILEDLKDPVHAIFVPVGGGGLIAGVAAWVKSVCPNVKVIGVEPDSSNCLQTALKNKGPVRLDDVDIFADGVAVKEIGGRPFEICKQWVDEVICVGSDDICAATKDIFEESRAVPEPSGALALAGIKAYAQRTGIRDANMVAVVSGGNLDFGKLEYVAQRATFLEGRRALLGVTVENSKDGLKRFLEETKDLKVEELDYRLNEQGIGKAFLGVGMSPGLLEKDDLIERLGEVGMPALDLTDSLLATQHASSMGSSKTELGNERLVRFEFSEKPGAMQKVLKAIAGEFCITKVHYQNHSAAVGRLLVGANIPSEEQSRFEAFLKQLHVSYEEETNGIAHKWFSEN